jgi:hypothetical protein
METHHLTAGRAPRERWPEYLMEAWGRGTFMVSAGVLATLLGNGSADPRLHVISKVPRGGAATLAHRCIHLGHVPSRQAPGSNL